MSKGVYYVREKDLWEDVISLYGGAEFPLRLAENLRKMVLRIVGSRRFDSCSNLVREEMISRAYNHVCLKLIDRKFDTKHGSRVYSWVSRVVLNECLKEIEEEQRRQTRFLDYAADANVLESVEKVPKRV